jgi:hypothetical protein
MRVRPRLLMPLFQDGEFSDHLRAWRLYQDKIDSRWQAAIPLDKGSTWLEFAAEEVHASSSGEVV